MRPDSVISLKYMLQASDIYGTVEIQKATKEITRMSIIIKITGKEHDETTAVWRKHLSKTHVLNIITGEDLEGALWVELPTAKKREIVEDLQNIVNESRQLYRTYRIQSFRAGALRAQSVIDKINS